MADPIDRNELLNVYKGYRDFDKVYIGSLRAEIKAQPGIYPAQPEIIRCKDCRKHNVSVGFDENLHTVWKEDACPLVIWRGKAQGHEFDYQYCVFAERRTDG